MITGNCSSIEINVYTGPDDQLILIIIYKKIKYQHQKNNIHTMYTKALDKLIQ